MFKFGYYKQKMIEVDEEIRKLQEQIRRLERTKSHYHHEHYKGLGSLIARSRLRKLKNTK